MNRVQQHNLSWVGSWQADQSSITSHKNLTQGPAAHSVFYLPEVSAVPLEAVLHGSHLQIFAVTLVVAG